MTSSYLNRHFCPLGSEKALLFALCSQASSGNPASVRAIDSGDQGLYSAKKYAFTA